MSGGEQVRRNLCAPLPGRRRLGAEEMLLESKRSRNSFLLESSREKAQSIVHRQANAWFPAPVDFMGE